MISEEKILEKLEKILDSELMETFFTQENEKELFNDNIIIENTFKILVSLAKEFEYP